MSELFSKHGTYSFDKSYIDQSIIICRLSDSWNMPTFKAFEQDLAAIYGELFASQSWG